jgi:hypothetical protein
MSQTGRFRAELAHRVGVAEDADTPTILAALDEALAERAESAQPSVVGAQDAYVAMAEAVAQMRWAREEIARQGAEIAQLLASWATFAGELTRRLGVAADSEGETILAALDEALTKGAAEQGRDLVDVDDIAQPRADAEMDRTHQKRAVTDNAFQEGKITPYQRPRWEAMTEGSADGAEALLAGAKRNSAIPGEPISHSGGLDIEGDSEGPQYYRPQHRRRPRPTRAVDFFGDVPGPPPNGVLHG